MQDLFIQGTWKKGEETKIEYVEKLLASCQNINDLEIPYLEDWGFRYELGIYRCGDSHVFYFEGDDEEGFTIRLEDYQSLNEAKKAWNDAIETIVNEIRDLANNYEHHEEIRTELLNLAKEIKSETIGS